jgi:hypothetical protein
MSSATSLRSIACCPFIKVSHSSPIVHLLSPKLSRRRSQRCDPSRSVIYSFLNSSNASPTGNHIERHPDETGNKGHHDKWFQKLTCQHGIDLIERGINLLSDFRSGDDDFSRDKD